MEAAAIQERAIHCPKEEFQANSRIPRNPRIQEPRFGRAPPAAQACQSDGLSHEGWRLEMVWKRARAFIRHINLPVSFSSPGWPTLCQPNGSRLPTLWGAMSQGIVGRDLACSGNGKTVVGL